jgi:hypothetical protein
MTFSCRCSREKKNYQGHIDFSTDSSIRLDRIERKKNHSMFESIIKTEMIATTCSICNK